MTVARVVRACACQCGVTSSSSRLRPSVFAVIRRKIQNACCVRFQCNKDVLTVYNLSYLRAVFGECLYVVCRYNCILFLVLVVGMNDGK